ncbi:MAG: tRNA preQ1(34) S-adenosylmethionine ribosyltransferase-isomerase QueA [Fidelibacterota bacterium]|nr:MAG: tRNA preQ1(34) S-adenosylmethionine ribosyltransferase-isomerase QueA [Candidatus Neomarinimicrobiota bacterium]
MDTPIHHKTPQLSDFDLQIPDRLIAQFPNPERDQCRLMVLDRNDHSIANRHFYQLPEFLDEGDVLVLNDTRVFPARLFATREKTGAQIEVLLLQETGPDQWEVLVKPGRKARVGGRLAFEGGVTGDIIATTASGGRLVRFTHDHLPFEQFLEQHGKSPLPPYIRREPEPQDRQTYQTVYARHRGAVAAPTAGLHFTEALLETVASRGVSVTYITLHVGLGTFRPVQEEDITRHQMDAEYYHVSAETANTINDTVAGGGRIVAVGTTTARALETVAIGPGKISNGSGWTEKFIYPPYTFLAVDALITNFHQPKSSLIMLVSAFAGKPFLFEAYQKAVQDGYRFYSYGDAMLIL